MIVVGRGRWVQHSPLKKASSGAMHRTANRQQKQRAFGCVCVCRKVRWDNEEEEEENVDVKANERTNECDLSTI